MAAEEDNFDIDIYGDGGEEYHEEGLVLPDAHEGHMATTQPETSVSYATDNAGKVQEELHYPHEHDDGVTRTMPANEHAPVDTSLPKQPLQVQGLKRKEGIDDRSLDPGATTALYISELHWWITDDDIRGWANQSECEDELEDVTFNEQKVNGKSKGQAYVLFKSPQAATLVKHKVDTFGDSQKYKAKFTVNYTNPHSNPFKTLPKDGPMRTTNQGNRSAPGGYNNNGTVAGSQNSTFNLAAIRGGRGGYPNNRGGMSNMGGYNNRGGFQQPIPGGYQGNAVNSFQGMAAMPSYGGFNRGGMMGGGMRASSMGMRGGRGGMNANSMMGMPIGGMNMGGMPNMGMGMPAMNAGMGMQGTGGFQGSQAHYNPAFFSQQVGQGGADSNWNPHGAKRTRQE